MRLFSILAAVAIAAMTVTSCGSFGQATASSQNPIQNTTVNSASTNGRAAGAALNSLHKQYQRDGKIDMSNVSNLLNLATLAKNMQGLKGQPDNSAFYKDFATGLVLGSNNLINQENSKGVMNGLSNLLNNVDMSGLKNAAETVKDKAANATQKGTEVVENASTIATSVGNILNLFKK